MWEHVNVDIILILISGYFLHSYVKGAVESQWKPGGASGVMQMTWCKLNEGRARAFWRNNPSHQILL